MSNKVNFGLKNAHFAPFEIVDGEEVYDTPISLPGMVELSLEPRGDMGEFYADDRLYWGDQNNQGYDGTLTIANIPEDFLTKVLGETKDEDDGVISENANAKGKPFALLFEFDGDVKATRFVLYNCTANRPNISSSTKTASVEPNTNELTFVASQRESDSLVRTRTSTDTPQAIHDAWYDAVYEKASA